MKTFVVTFSRIEYFNIQVEANSEDEAIDNVIEGYSQSPLDLDNIEAFELDGEEPTFRVPLKDGEPCSHIGCLNHMTHPCERCGRIGGIRS